MRKVRRRQKGKKTANIREQKVLEDIRSGQEGGEFVLGCACVHACICVCVHSGHGPALLSVASWLTGSCITISNTIMYTLHSGTLL